MTFFDGRINLINIVDFLLNEINNLGSKLNKKFLI